MRVLYLSYDGMTDPLGQSQVIPYLAGLSAKGHQITLLSCEKPERFAQAQGEIRRLLASYRIAWHPLAYHRKPPVVSTLYDLHALGKLARKTVRESTFDIVHCRSYLPALVGLRLKKEFALKFVFDMRGFWADERVDGRLWNLKNPLYALIFRYFKRKELEFIQQADSIISLTHAGKAEILRWKLDPEAETRMTIIPCCADLAHFRRELVLESDRSDWRKKLDLTEADFVVTYLGSLGTWYLLEEMLRFFKELAATRKNAKFFFITPDDPQWIFDAAAREGIARDRLRVQKASRAEVPVLLSLTQLGLFFIRPSYSKISSSPTKLAEYLAMGIPVVTNGGVGDNEWLAARYPIGALVSNLGSEAFAQVISRLSGVEKLLPADLRAVALAYFSLENGVEQYHRIYTSLGQGLEL